MTDRCETVADLLKALAAYDKGRVVIAALDAVHASRRDPLRFIQPIK